MLFERWDINPVIGFAINKTKYLLKEYDKDSRFTPQHYIMLNNYRVINTDFYYHCIKNCSEIKPSDALMYIYINGCACVDLEYYFPLIYNYWVLVNFYLSKKGFHQEEHRDDTIVPATGLKYLVIGRYQRRKAIIEIFDADEIVNKLNMPRIFEKAIENFELNNGSKKELTMKDYDEFLKLFKSQKIFAGYNAYEALRILGEYFGSGNTKRDEAVHIIDVYNKIFDPMHKACYDIERLNRIECPTIKIESFKNDPP